DVLAPVVDGDRVSDHVRKDRRRTRPGAQHLLRPGGVQVLDPLYEPLLDERPLLHRPTQVLLLLHRATRRSAQPRWKCAALSSLLLPAAPAADDQPVRLLVL